MIDAKDPKIIQFLEKCFFFQLSLCKQCSLLNHSCSFRNPLYTHNDKDMVLSSFTESFELAIELLI